VAEGLGPERLAGCAWEDVAATDRLRADSPLWLERRLEVEPSEQEEIGIWLELYGAATLYLDGVAVAGWGEVEDGAAGLAGSGRRFRRLPAPAARELTLGLYFEPMAARGLGWLGSGTGFRLWAGEPFAVLEAWRHFTRVASGHQFLFVGAFGAQALLHLLLFAFSPRIRSNAWFAGNCVISAALAFVQFEVALSEDLDRLESLYRIWGPLLFADMAVLLGFVYEAFDQPRRAWFWLLQAFALGLGAYSFVEPEVNAFSDLWWFHLLALGESVRVNLLAVRRGWRGAWIIAVGLLLLGCGLVWQQLLALGLVAPPLAIFPAAYYGVAALLVSVSTYLSFHFARMGRTLRDRLQQVEALSARSLQQERAAKELDLSRRLLEAENLRKSEELEAARALQLSLLPRELPRLEGVDIAAAMETATEVGGDYYDAVLGPDGALVVLVGDATGHGARAGALVSLMKGMFVRLRPGEDLGGFLAGASAAVRAMRLDRARLAMCLARLDGDRLTFAAAGMPPALVVRAETGQVLELLTPAMPLGGLSRHFPQREVALRPGDTVVLLSDGLVELTDAGGEPLGYERVRDLVGRLAAAHREDAQGLVAALFAEARAWNGNATFPDDVTIVVLRARLQPSRRGADERTDTGGGASGYEPCSGP
jgi:serine phosphatase RsbU (regulator of sigma subunit)